ncbi:TetR/AcrR family transcriptional regulator [Flexivirga sp. ID2601S]|uniref:TetR/AcrR family transcriptional regulator n=1 Tax=Flexivirga aerilata TaxID=1656889 RepID=A0A849AHH8_9MICO|nr:TetR/AcrR family transcriptional regulator [Flexivirga aerilata]NNG39016.1 TetR/AcrR family transcriptional regulator [Flexivirga aerilata]
MPETTPWNRARDAQRKTQRDARRVVLVDAAIAAIEADGPDVSVAQIARTAGVTKPVLYRQFDDKDDLMRAVGVAEGERILAAIRTELNVPGVSSLEVVTRAVDAFLHAIDQHPQVYLALMRRRSGDDLRLTQQGVTDYLYRLIHEVFVASGIDAAGAQTWAHCIVAMGVAAGELYLSTPEQAARDRIGQQVTDLIIGGLAGIAGSSGVELDAVATGLGRAFSGVS